MDSSNSVSTTIIINWDCQQKIFNGIFARSDPKTAFNTKLKWSSILLLNNILGSNPGNPNILWSQVGTEIENFFRIKKANFGKNSVFCYKSAMYS